MTTLAILPIKGFEEAKQRLAPELAGGARRALAEAMVSDVLTALRRASSVDRILVISSDHSAQRIAGGQGATVIEDHVVGHSKAAALGITLALDEGVDRALLVPGDCPLLEPAELDQLIARPVSPRSAIIVPDRHGSGTNALLLTPPDALTPSFGPDSCARHVQLAHEQGTTAEIVRVPSLALDIDTPDDLVALQVAVAATRGGAAHTRGMLSQLIRSRA